MNHGSSSSKFNENTSMQKPGLKLDPFVSRNEHNPKELKSWAKKTGYTSSVTEETVPISISPTIILEDNLEGLDLEKGVEEVDKGDELFEIASVLGRSSGKEKEGDKRVETEPVSVRSPRGGLRKKWFEVEYVTESDDEDEELLRLASTKSLTVAGLNYGAEERLRTLQSVGNERNRGVPGFTEDEGRLWSVGSDAKSEVTMVPADGEEHEQKKSVGRNDVRFNMFSEDPEGTEPENSGVGKAVVMRCGLRDTPGLAFILYYALQHYLSLSGSLIFIPLIIVPAMGGTDKDTATVVSTMLLVSGITTILHSYFGTRLPLVQGSSFVYLAPVLVILNSREHRNLAEHRFRHIMKELQGAIIVGSFFQSILGYSGFMSLFLRLINPVVVAPTIAAVGLAFFSYGFPQAGSCVEISIPLIMLILVFSLYLRGVSIYGHQVFRVYAVPLSISIVWIYALLLTAGGAYNYKGCNPNIPSSNNLSNACREHASTMKHCRTDSSNAWRTADWIRVPFPFQWGFPTFRLRTCIIMTIVSLIASVDSVAIYHFTALLVSSRPPTPGIVSRGIGLEGLCSFLAGLWGTGFGSTTLTENVHTIEITKVANRRSVELGAVILILSSIIGKVGALIASIPQALAASVLCFTWALIVALGLSTFQYAETKSFRNIMIICVSLFLSLSVPAYFQQYQPVSSFILPSYLLPYAATSNGPFHTGVDELDFALNGLFSLNMVIAFFIAFILDNTVPGSRQERGVYVWLTSEDVHNDPSLLADYSLPRKVARYFSWAKCVGT